MHTASTMLAGHHRDCDALFAAAEQQADKGQWADCQRSTNEFVTELLAHFGAEETLLFPAFEQATGMSSGPTRMMRMEHEQMRELAQQLVEAAAAQQRETYLGTCDTLLVLMEQHNLKEENILYPMCDQAVGHDAALLEQLEQIVEQGGVSQ